MPTPPAQGKAAELRRQLVTLTGDQHARVKPWGTHLLIQTHSAGADGDGDGDGDNVDGWNANGSCPTRPTRPAGATTPRTRPATAHGER